MWTEERKAKMRLQVQRWKPWEKPTGPKTAAGKAVSKRNAQKHGTFSAENLKQLAEIRQLIKP
jgi:hypothetical protein